MAALASSATTCNVAATASSSGAAAAASTSTRRSAAPSFVLTFHSDTDRPGIVSKLSTTLAQAGGNITESQQFGDPSTNAFFLRSAFTAEPNSSLRDIEAVRSTFEPVGKELGGTLQVHSADDRPRVLVLVSKIGHALNDLLFRARTGQLAIEVVAIVSNHTEFEPLARASGIPFTHIPVTKDTKAEAERRLLDIVRSERVELVVMARYMQILSGAVCDAVDVINVHHGALPAFPGAKPYHQAYAHGVKLIGATSHFATSDLDEGPIIEQDLVRVNHAQDATALTHAGSAIECIVLARAVKWWAERRVFRNGRKTVVFS